MFNIGDVVYIPVFGAGYILSIEDKEICGKVGKYYVIHFIINNMNIMIPVHSKEADKIRKTIKPEEYVKILEILGDSPKKLPGKWLERYKHYRDAINCGSVFKLAGVLRDIASLSRNKKLSRSEFKVLDEVLDMVSSEISLVLGRNFVETRVFILNFIMSRKQFC